MIAKGGEREKEPRGVEKDDLKLVFQDMNFTFKKLTWVSS